MSGCTTSATGGSSFRRGWAFSRAPSSVAASTSTPCRRKRRPIACERSEAALPRPPRNPRSVDSGLVRRRLPLFRLLHFPVAARCVHRSAEAQALVLRLLDQHDRLERVDVVDPLLLALRRNLRLVRPVIELHLRDTGDLADLPQVELDLVQMLDEVDRLEEGHFSAHWHG